MGPANARITLVEFSDFQCPYCSKAVAQINATLKAYPNDVRLIFKQYPLDSHPASFDLGVGRAGGACAGEILADARFDVRQPAQVVAAVDSGMGARDIGLDMKRFTADLDSDAIKKAVLRDQADGDKAGVEGTPTVFVNGQKYNGDLAPEAMQAGDRRRVEAAGGEVRSRRRR